MADDCEQINTPEVDNTGLECIEFVKDLCVTFPLANAYLGLPVDSTLRDTINKLIKIIQANQRLITTNVNDIDTLESGDDIKVVNIGDWDMDATDTVNIAHGLTATEWKTVRAIEVIIRQDDDLKYDKIDSSNSAGVVSGSAQSIDVTNINLIRTTGGAFDSVIYNSTSFNRGFIHITYKKD